uniref:C-Maf-inducing protein n=1 Tax=Romanomermis culicivorax TaxID=13658 RepID=A0A915I2M1_ROMCU
MRSVITFFIAGLESPNSEFAHLETAQSRIAQLAIDPILLHKVATTKQDKASGAMEQPVKYALMEDVHALPQWDSTLDKFCIRIFIPEGSVLLQTNHVYTRNQWLYSIQWRRNLYRYRRIIELSSGRPEVLLKETKCLVEQVKCCPLQGDNLSLKAVLLISRLIEQIFAGNLPKTMLDPVIMCIAPLLDTVGTVTQVSPWLSMYCNDHPRSRLIDEVLSEVAQQTLKKTMDFGKYPTARIFVQDYLLAVSSQNNGVERIKNFVNSAHSLSSCCPHPRVLPNLVTVSLAAVHALYDQQQQQQNFSPKKSTENGGGDVVSLPPTPPYETPSLTFTDDEDRREKLRSEFEDWRVPLSVLLQPIPFPDEVLCEPAFARDFGNGVLRRLAADGRCEIHLSLLGARENKEGWFHLVCPGGPVCSDDGELFSSMLKTLLHCCCRRKKFLQTLNAMLGPLQLLALRENEPSMEALCHMLEFEVVEGQDLKVQMITALQSTPQGKKHYAQLCDRQIALRELQQKGGPRKLTLPSKSTDSDLAVLLSSGSFGNLEWLSLAFTNVTSSCADYLIKLPSLRYLNLWSTQFGDTGLQLLSEHLTKLQVLNLCETPVTDKGLSTLKSLRKLNLNSTQLSAKTFLVLKTELPALQEVDVRYTDAWCVEDALLT